MRLKLALCLFVILLPLSGCHDSFAVNARPTLEPSPSAIITPAPTPTPTPTPAPTPTPTPPPDPYFLPEGEEVIEDEENGYWLYRSPVLFVEVNRIYQEKGPKTYFVADVRFKEGQREIAGFGTPDKPGKSYQALYKITKYYQAVIAVNGDYINKVKHDKKGIIMRDGKTYVNKNQMDTLAFYPDGTMRIYRPGEITSQELLDDGVLNTFSFGPTLINNGVVEPKLDKHRLARRNPRTAVGMIEPYHYILVVADGRQRRYSVGLTMQELAEVFAEYGCQVAYNLDGGKSATMSFMGKNINRFNGSLTGQRKVPDALMFGFTELLAK
ncbi:MAG: phosphodiester glycosidase family protein [Christensenellales bacterium]